MRRTALLLLVLGGGCDLRSRQPEPPPPPDTARLVSDTVTSRDYVQRTLDAQLGEPPKMGWFVPPARFVGSSRHDSVFVLSDAREVERFAFGRQLDSAERAAFSSAHGVGCDAPDTLYEYSGKPVSAPVRALYAGRPFGGRVNAGARFAMLSDSALARTRALLTGGTVAAYYRDTAIAVAAELPFYSFHLAYDSTRTLTRAGMFLHTRDGRLLGREIVSVSEDEMCDGCAVPRYEDGIEHWFRIVNAFELPGFLYPVLLLDTSTFEGRALSLVSFSPAGVASHFRQYEYTFNCR